MNFKNLRLLKKFHDLKLFMDCVTGLNGAAPSDEFWPGGLREPHQPARLPKLVGRPERRPWRRRELLQQGARELVQRAAPRVQEVPGAEEESASQRAAPASEAARAAQGG